MGAHALMKVSAPSKAGDPVFRRQRGWNRDAAAYSMPLSRARQRRSWTSRIPATT